MLKATYFSKYRKQSTGNLVLLYVVSGTAAEEARYLEAQRAQAPNARWQDDNGKPLYYVSGNSDQGQLPQKSYSLLITQNNKVVVDDQVQMFADAAVVNKFKLEHKGRILAERDLGIGRERTVSTPAQPTPETKVVEPNREGEIRDELENEPANAGSGTEGLGE